MFQNIDIKNDGSTVNTIDNNYNKGKFEIFNSIIGQVFTKQNVILYLISFMMSMVSVGDGIAPFSMAIFAAACSNLIPVACIYFFSMIGTAIRFGSIGALNYLLTSLLFIAMVLIFKPWYEEEYNNERRKLGKYVFLSTLIIKITEMFFKEVLIYDFLLSIATSLVTYIFYKIFSKSIIVIKEWGIKKAFSIEEIIGACLMISIALISINSITFFNLNIGQVIMIIMILVLGWKNGVMVGATVGITVGAVVGIIGDVDPILMASFAISGMVAGLLNRFGKFGVVLGFMIGNAILTFVYNGNTTAVVYFKEILVASLGLILIPKNIKINIEDLFDKSTALPEGAIYKLEGGKDTASKLNNVSDLIHEISDTYNNAKEQEVDSKEVFLDELDKQFELRKDSLLYEDIMDNYNNEIIDDTYELLKNKNKISSIDLQEIFKNHNSNIFSLDSETDLEEIEKETQDVANIINEAYKISNLNYIWSKKIKDDKRVISNQLDNVSEAISEIAKDIATDKNEFNKEKAKIKILAKNKNINILDIKIKRIKEKYLINLYTDRCKEECYIENISEILSEVLNDEIVLQGKKCAIDVDNNLCKQLYASKDKYSLRVGIAKRTKDKSVISGDTYVKTTLDDGKVLVALSDGMGSGNEARKSSKIAIKMLENLLKNGFDKDTSLKLINNTMCLNSKDDMYATLDISIFDLYNGNLEIIKNGSCPTYIKSKNDVQFINSISLPAGILDNIDLVTFDRDLEDGDIIVMCTDGIIDSNSEYKNKEMWIKDLLMDINTDDVKRIADIILHESIDNNFGKPKDDMTIIVAKIIKI